MKVIPADQETYDKLWHRWFMAKYNWERAAARRKPTAKRIARAARAYVKAQK